MILFSVAFVVTNSCKNSEAISNLQASNKMDVTTLDYKPYLDSLQAEGVFLLLDLKPCTFLTQMYIPLKNMNFKKIYISIVYVRASLTRFLPMIFTDKSLTSNDNHKTTMQ